MREHDLLAPGPIVLAVSGGADSTALLILMSSVAGPLGLALHVAHFDHRLRPRASARDAQFVADLAQQHGATIRVGRADARPKSENEARELRYAFLRRAARDVGATRIATGHTRDDQAETVLLHATRGSGIAGLAGMRPRRDDIIRPFLCIGRAETALVCREAGIAPREDPTNRTTKYARNRMRNKVLPELERINPQVRLALARLADAAAAASEAAHGAAVEALDAATTPDGIALDRLAAHVRDDALAIAWMRATGRALAARHRAALGTLASSRAGSAALDLPGGEAVREYGWLRLGPAAEPLPAPETEVELSEDGVIDWAGWRIGLTRTRPPDATAPLWVAAPAEGALFVRSRRPGDRLSGHLRIKVQDLFTDAKVPARDRAGHPLIATSAGAIWWVVGLKRADGEPSDSRWIVASPPGSHAGVGAPRA